MIKALKRMKCRLMGHKSPIDVFVMKEQFRDYDRESYLKTYEYTICNYCDIKFEDKDKKDV